MVISLHGGQGKVKQQRVAFCFVCFPSCLFLPDMNRRQKVPLKGLTWVKTRTVRFACQDHWSVSREGSCINSDEDHDGPKSH